MEASNTINHEIKAQFVPKKKTKQKHDIIPLDTLVVSSYNDMYSIDLLTYVKVAKLCFGVRISFTFVMKGLGLVLELGLALFISKVIVAEIDKTRLRKNLSVL